MLESGGRLSYSQAMMQVTGERMRDERRGIFAGRGGFTGEFRPQREGVRMVGRVGDKLSEIVAPMAGVREVWVVGWPNAHYVEKHAGQFDIARAEGLLPGVLADPARIVRGKKANTLVFVGDYDDAHYLVVPVKALPGELWLETTYVARKREFDRHAWVRNGEVYRREV